MFGISAWALRRAAEALHLPGMLRWDHSGRALLISDAPRRGASEPIELPGARAFTAQGLLFLDYDEASYRALAAHWAQHPACPPPPDLPFERAVLLQGICRRPPPPPGAVDEPLLRACLLAIARGGAAAETFEKRLRGADAIALCRKDTWSIRACAAMLLVYIAHPSPP
ncbi:MAG: hypothetical protein LBM74_03785 [Oscillospiraceae bacterium]|jgi:hypothetical protein|nr:hypothetical protein [Oscillospiraceae bacterium]